jgi:hypothetical protein
MDKSFRKSPRPSLLQGVLVWTRHGGPLFKDLRKKGFRAVKVNQK